MTSVKVKFRPSTVTGKMGSIYYQVIHGRMVRQISTNYKNTFFRMESTNGTHC